MFQRTALLAACLAVVLLAAAAVPAGAEADRFAVPDTVTLLELGSPGCPPCRAMAPILAELEEDYQDRVAFVSVDVWERPGVARAFGVRYIPTQIFFDRRGREVSRHQGFWSRAELVRALAELGVAPPGRETAAN
jgi:thioredoxin 1